MLRNEWTGFSLRRAGAGGSEVTLEEMEAIGPTVATEGMKAIGAVVAMGLVVFGRTSTVRGGAGGHLGVE
jgi:hypothetical protein